MSITLRRLRALQLLIELLQNKESFLFLTVIGYETLSIEVVLNAGERSSRTAKILENPWRGTTKKGNALQHSDLVLVERFLILLGPACLGVAMVAKEGVGSEFAQDHWLIVFRRPIRGVEVGNGMAVPADILIAAHHVELVCNRIVQANRKAATVLYFVFLESCGDQTCRITGMCLLNELAQESIARVTDGCFVGNRIDDESRTITISSNQLVELIFRVA